MEVEENVQEELHNMWRKNDKLKIKPVTSFYSFCSNGYGIRSQLRSDRLLDLSLRFHLFR